MKKNCLVFAACILFLPFLFISASSDKSGNRVVPSSFWKQGDIASENVLGIEKSGEVFATGPEGATIVGSDTGGAEDEKGVFIKGRTVHLDPFIISKYEVTIELYRTVMADEPFEYRRLYCEYDDEPSHAQEHVRFGEPFPKNERHIYRPVESLSFYDMVSFCNMLSLKTGLDPAYKIMIKKEEEISHKCILYSIAK